MLTGKCKTDFEFWFNDKYGFFPFINPLEFAPSFYEMSLSFQYGVYVDFFDSVGIVISIMAKLKVKEGFMYSIDHIIPNDYSVDFETRQEAREQAIIKANEIYNNY